MTAVVAQQSEKRLGQLLQELVEERVSLHDGEEYIDLLIVSTPITSDFSRMSVTQLDRLVNWVND